MLIGSVVSESNRYRWSVCSLFYSWEHIKV